VEAEGDEGRSNSVDAASDLFGPDAPPQRTPAATGGGLVGGIVSTLSAVVGGFLSLLTGSAPASEVPADGRGSPLTDAMRRELEAAAARTPARTAAETTGAAAGPLSPSAAQDTAARTPAAPAGSGRAARGTFHAVVGDPDASDSSEADSESSGESGGDVGTDSEYEEEEDGEEGEEDCGEDRDGEGDDDKVGVIDEKVAGSRKGRAPSDDEVVDLTHDEITDIESALSPAARPTPGTRHSSARKPKGFGMSHHPAQTPISVPGTPASNPGTVTLSARRPASHGGLFFSPASEGPSVGARARAAARRELGSDEVHRARSSRAFGAEHDDGY